MYMPAIEIKGLTKKFGSFTAVDGVSFDVEEGEIFGLLGPNGAGKTTTISMLATLLKKSGGDARINGFPLSRETDVRKSIGMVFQDQSLDDELTGMENLDFHGRMYRMPKQLRERRICEVIKLVELESKAKMQVKTYSGGMKRRLEIARGLIHHPKILFLDEPTLGLDPQTRRGIWDYIMKLNKEEKVTIILTTHYMEEADYLCGRIAIIDQGRIVACDTPDNLKNVIGGDVLTLETPATQKLKKHLKFGWIKKVEISGRTMRITLKDGEKSAPKILAVACSKKIVITSMSLKKPSLEDVFLRYTGKSIREQEASSLDSMRLRMRMG